MTRSKVDINRLDAVVKRLSRRSNKIAKAIISPCPISSKAPLQFLSPCAGKATVVLVLVQGMQKEGVKVTIRLTTEETTSQTEFLSNKNVKRNIEMDMRSGDLLEVFVESMSNDDFHEAFIAALWKPEIKEAEVRKFLIDELDKLEESNASHSE